MISKYGKKLLVIALVIIISVSSILLLVACDKEQEMKPPEQFSPKSFNEASRYMADKYVFPEKELQERDYMNIICKQGVDASKFIKELPRNILDKVERVEWLHSYENLVLKGSIMLESATLDFTTETDAEVVQKYVINGMEVRQSIDKLYDKINLAFNYEDIAYEVNWQSINGMNSTSSKIFSMEQKEVIARQARDYVESFKLIKDRADEGEDNTIKYPSNIAVKNMNDLSVYIGKEFLYSTDDGVSEILIQFHPSYDTTDDRKKQPYKLDQRLMIDYSWQYCKDNLMLKVSAGRNPMLYEPMGNEVVEDFEINGIAVRQVIGFKSNYIIRNYAQCFFTCNGMNYIVYANQSVADQSLEELQLSGKLMRDYIATFKKIQQ